MAFYDWALANNYNENLSIDRIDVNKGYYPSNCRWTDAKTQANNQRNNHIIEYEGEKHSISEWADILNISRDVLYSRLKNGWSVRRAFMEQVHN